ncbi:ATPase E1 [Klebsormidium nitens]|uniref:ATPase E1 n=1 Tax=Klebsormidium nitens TaxID=105231 RepID=A0A1Y1IHY8_KLENI|nr:ATPase E1 [Klebsormidium nitens]|eukprot:GAQ89119.1 ATPase E1 [Klebsormidium nitens]
MAIPVANPKTTLYIGGLDEAVTEGILHAAFIPFGDIKDINTPLDQATQKHRGFGFITYMEAEDAAAALDNMNNAELYGRVLTVNVAQPIKIKGGEQGWANQPVWAEADTWFERQQQEEELERLKKEHEEDVRRGQAQAKVQVPGRDVEEEEPTNGRGDSMEEAEAQALTT